MRHRAHGPAALLAVVALAACSNSTPTAPSTLPGSSSRIAAQAEPSAGEGGFFGTSDNRIRGPLQPSDAAFVSFAASASQAGLQLGTLAASNGDQRRVKALGEQMKQYHTAALVALRELAPDHVGQTPSLSTAQQQMVTDVTRVTGSAFDRAFVPLIIQSLEATIAEFSQHATSGDPELQEFSAGYLSGLRDLLRLARDVATSSR